MSQTLIYGLLAIAIAFEVIGTTLMAQTAQFTRPLPTLGMAACYGVAFYCLSIIVTSLPVGIVYAVWSGLGIVLIAALNFIVFKQSLELWAIFGLGLIVAGVVVLNTLSGSVSH